MRSRLSEAHLSLAILCVVIAVQAIVLTPELSPTVIRQSDASSHYAMVAGMVDAVERGGNPLDFWSPEGTFGFPIVRTYQIFAHGLVAFAYFALGKTVSLPVVYAWASYLTILLLPIAIYAGMRLMEFAPLTAALATVIAPLIAGPGVGGLGFDYRTWLRFGVLPQCVATSLLLLALGLSWRALRTGRGRVLAGAVLGCTMLAHLIYGWMGAISVCLMALLPDHEIARRPRIIRTLQVGVVALVLCVFQFLPILQDGYLINRSRVEQAEKFDSYGAAKVLDWMFRGRIMDNDRMPVLSLLAFGSAILILGRFRQRRKMPAIERFVLAGAVFWTLVFFGRPTWGILLVLLGVTPELHLHRLLAAVQIFLMFVCAIGLAELCRGLTRRWNALVAMLAAGVILWPAIKERADYLQSWQQAVELDSAALRLQGKWLDVALADVRKRGGRAYAGLQTNWGTQFIIGGTPIMAYLWTARIPAVSFPYNASALPTDIMMLFDERNPAHYRLFNVHSVIVPPGGAPANFLLPAGGSPRFRVLDAPGNGYFDVVDVAGEAPVTRESFYDFNAPWFQSDWFAKQQYIRLDMHGESPGNLPVMSAGFLPPVPAPAVPAGAVTSERQTGEQYEADFDASRPSFALFKMTWHPNWHVTIDGQTVKSVMLSPGFLGAPVTPGHHHIVCRYEPGNLKIFLAFGGLLVVVLLGCYERRLPKSRQDVVH